ncbi:hypothetical protein EJ110_NYTH53771 [Nymphaea thermarum]|nr:hypothetical protein EJ110_NYTH53771 [Nymphaea thermarum]
MGKGDLCFFYRSGGKAMAHGGRRSRSDQSIKEWYLRQDNDGGTVDMEGEEGNFDGHLLLKQPHLSVMAVRSCAWDCICKLDGF